MVLVQPQLGENIGAAARGMWNFGLRRMRIVDPRDGWPNPVAIANSSGAGGLLDEARLFETTAEAIADCQMVYATTARPREMTKRVLTPEAAMAEAAGLIAGGQRVAVLFGRERSGLENADIVAANAIVSVPVNPAFASLNLAQCVLLMSYEWRRLSDATPPDQLVVNSGEEAMLADSANVGRVIAHLTEELDRSGFFWPESKRPSMIANLENLFRRMPLTEPDVRILRGVIRSLSEMRARGRLPGEAGQSKSSPSET